jgi:tRNA(adenine34) deaminase
MGIAQTGDEAWMRHAIRLAERAEALGEVPIGALIVKDGQCLAEGWNCPIATHDPTAHAEIMALRHAGLALENYRLVDATLYVTLERIRRLVFGAFDPKRGAVCHALSLSDAGFLNHRVSWEGGVMETECSAMLKEFFKARR